MAKITKPSVLTDYKEQAPSPPKSILQQAHEIIYGDREQTHGTPDKNLKTISEYWSTHLTASTGEKITLTIDDVCDMMMLLKLARRISNPQNQDNLIDIAGYAGLADRCKNT